MVLCVAVYDLLDSDDCANVPDLYSLNQFTARLLLPSFYPPITLYKFPYCQPRTVGYLYPDHYSSFLKGGD
jgi:hypothetical protein